MQSLHAIGGERISLECKLDEHGINLYKKSEAYKETYSALIEKGVDENSARRTALGMKSLNFEFKLKGIEIDKDFNDAADLGKGFIFGKVLMWSPDSLSYTNYFGEEWYFANISRESLRYTLSMRNIKNLKKPTEIYYGKCEIIKLKTKF